MCVCPYLWQFPGPIILHHNYPQSTLAADGSVLSAFLENTKLSPPGEKAWVLVEVIVGWFQRECEE